MARERPALSRERIVEEALALLDAGGLEGFSMRKLAARLGVEAMSIYHHFPNRQAILNAAADRIIGQIVLPPDGVGWRGRLEQFAEGTYRILMAHPAMVSILAMEVADPVDPPALAVIDQTLATLAAAGFSPMQQATIFHAITAMVFGFVLDHTRGLVSPVGGREGDVPGNMGVIEARAEEIPHLVALIPSFQAMRPGDDFRLALRLFLDGLEREPREGGDAIS